MCPHSRRITSWSGRPRGYPIVIAAFERTHMPLSGVSHADERARWRGVPPNPLLVDAHRRKTRMDSSWSGWDSRDKPRRVRDEVGMRSHPLDPGFLRRIPAKGEVMHFLHGQRFWRGVGVGG